MVEECVQQGAGSVISRPSNGYGCLLKIRGFMVAVDHQSILAE